MRIVYLAANSEMKIRLHYIEEHIWGEAYTPRIKMTKLLFVSEQKTTQIQSFHVSKPRFRCKISAILHIAIDNATYNSKQALAAKKGGPRDYISIYSNIVFNFKPQYNNTLRLGLTALVLVIDVDAYLIFGVSGTHKGLLFLATSCKSKIFSNRCFSFNNITLPLRRLAIRQTLETNISNNLLILLKLFSVVYSYYQRQRWKNGLWYRQSRHMRISPMVAKTEFISPFSSS